VLTQLFRTYTNDEKMKKAILLSIIMCLVITSGCKKSLNRDPEDFTLIERYFTKEKDAVLALNGVMDLMSSRNYYGGTFQIRMLGSDDILPTITGSYPGNASAPASDPAFANLWNNLFMTIERANILLENLPRIAMDEKKKGVIRGEALFLRAYAMFMLVDMWGPIPINTVPTSGPNDVIRKRQPIQDVYAQILKDMTEAEGLVPTMTLGGADYGGGGYIAKTTVQGILARVCLTMAGEPLKDVSKYQDAKDWAKKVVLSTEHALNTDYTDIFIRIASDRYDKKEVMWEIDLNYTAGTNEFGFIGSLNGIGSNVSNGADVSYGYSFGQSKATRRLYNAYGATSNDTRRDWNMAPFYYVQNTTTGAKVNWATTQIYDRFDSKYRSEYYPVKHRDNTGINFPMLRYPDVLLMLAEAENELNGPTTLAYSLVNQVRARAYGKLKPLATNLTEANIPIGQDQTTFRQTIRDERLREFPSEALRKHDLIRWGIYVSAMKAVAADANNVTPVASNRANLQAIANRITNKDVLWPIPSSELSLNSAMTQNEGW
jgi:hypothetical protein